MRDSDRQTNSGEMGMQQPTQGTLPGDTVNNASDAERRLWLAVLMQAVEDWRGGTLRARRTAQSFLFETTSDFDTVCTNAGLDADNLRSKLLKIGSKVQAQGPWARHPLAA
jgi:hypothetical protein